MSNYQHQRDRQLAVRVLGHPLKRTQPIHHHHGPRKRHLVICESVAYHALLHQRMRTLDAGGDPNYERVCSQCRMPRLEARFKGGYCEWCVSTNARDRGWFEQPRRGSRPLGLMLAFMARLKRELGRAPTPAEFKKALRLTKTGAF